MKFHAAEEPAAPDTRLSTLNPEIEPAGYALAIVRMIDRRPIRTAADKRAAWGAHPRRLPPVAHRVGL